MRMILQSAFTDHYLTQSGTWTRTATEARIFEEWLDAYEFTLEQDLVDTYIVPMPEPEPSSDSIPALPEMLSELQLK